MQKSPLLGLNRSKITEMDYIVYHRVGQLPALKGRACNCVPYQFPVRGFNIISRREMINASNVIRIV